MFVTGRSQVPSPARPWRKTRVTLSLSYEMPWGIVGEKLGEWLIKGVLENTLADVLAGMKYYYETGSSPSDTLREQFRQKVVVL